MSRLRGRLRRLAFGLATVAGGRPLGFFIPYRHAAAARPGTGYPALIPLFEAAEPRFMALLDDVETFAPDLDRILAGEGPSRFDQDWFPRLDALAAYGLVRRERPRRIVEIGSGHSTRFLARAVRDAGLTTAITAIDPAPRADIAHLGVRHERRLLAERDPVLAELGAGDILFVDSSHIAMPGTDVDLIVGDVLPRLPSGALMHWHDILLPDSYPAQWGWRGYNESIPVAALIGGGGFDLVFSSHWVATRRPDRLSRGVIGRIACPPGAFETSLWLRRR